jgi:hypothetical protein
MGPGQELHQAVMISGSERRSDPVDRGQSHAGAGAGREDAEDQLFKQLRIIPDAADLGELGQPCANHGPFLAVTIPQFIDYHVHSRSQTNSGSAGALRWGMTMFSHPAAANFSGPFDASQKHSGSLVD